RGFGADDINSLIDARLSRFRQALRLTADQERNWPAFETGVREFVKLRLQQISDLRNEPPRSHVERLRQGAERLNVIAAAMKRLGDVEEPLYNSLSDGQKERFAQLARQARRHMARLEHAARMQAMMGGSARGGYARSDEDMGWRNGRGQGSAMRDDDQN